MVEKDGHELRLGKRTVKELMHEHSERVTDDAALRVILEEEERIKKISRLAKVMATHAGRKTVKEEDVRLVYQMEDEL